LLSEFDSFERSPEAVPSAGLNFHEYQNTAIENDQVELAERATIVTLDNSVTLFFEVRLGDSLPFLSQELFAIV
jgi:hypothetical protein